MKQPSTRRPATLWLLIILQVLLGLGALVSEVLIMAVPDGTLFQMPLSMLQYSPFTSYFIPGLLGSLTVWDINNR